MNRKLLGIAAVAIGGIIGASGAQAAPVDTLSVGVQIDGTLGSGVTFEASTTSGILNTAGSLSGYSWNANLTAFPVAPEPQVLAGTTNFSSTQSGNHHFRVYVTLQGITGATAPPLENFASGFTTNFMAGAVTDVTLSTYLDQANGLFATATLLASENMLNQGNTTQSITDHTLVSLLTGPYSLTEVFDIHFNGTCTDLGDGVASCRDISTIATDANPVPEPASLAIFGSALLGFGLLRRRRNG